MKEFTRPTKAWDFSWTSLPDKDPFKELRAHHYAGSPNKMKVKANAFVGEAVQKMAEGKISVVKVGNGYYAAEMKDKDSGRFSLAAFNVNGSLQAAIATERGNFKEFPVIGNEGSTVDLTQFYACFLMALYEKHEVPKNALEKAFEDYKAAGAINPEQIFELSEFMDYAFKEELIKPKVVGGHIDRLEENLVKAGALAGSVICGLPEILLGKGKREVSRKKVFTFKEAVSEFLDFANSHSWTEEEKLLIPSFPDDAIVLPEVMTIARRFVSSRSFKRPMVNAMWRADTSYGKSTGVEMLAGILGLPLLRLTCHSTMEKTEFLTQFVPVTGKDEVGDSASCELPSFETISYDPETAYEMITGVYQEDVTPEMCIQAISQRSSVDPMFRLNAAKAAFDEAFSHYHIFVDDDGKVDEKRTAERTDALLRAQDELTQAFEAAKNAPARMDNTPKFKLVESNFIKALQKGYLCEVQELSRIKDSGVLVGLNEYDRPGSIIPMVDGSFCTRHPEAFVVYTDNVGYNSCRPIDPSVIRRMAFVIDSTDLSEKEIKKRILYNTGFENTSLLDKMYAVWKEIRDFCRSHEYTDGACSPSELEMWVATVMIEGASDLNQTCHECIVSKCTSDPDEQADIMNSVVKVHLT